MLMILTYLKTIAETDSNGVAKIAQEIIKEPDWFSTTGLPALYVVIGGVIIYYVVGYIARIITIRTIRSGHKKWHRKDIEKRQETVVPLVQMLWRIILVSIVVVSIVKIVLPNIDLSPLFASAGIIGVALGFGSQTLVKDFITGLFIITENQFRAGDIVTIGSSSGTVEKIGGRTTVIRDAEGNVHYIPNSNITLVINKTMGWSMARFTLDVEPDTDINLLTEIINKVGAELAEDPDFVKKIQSPPKFDGIIGITGNSIKIVINGKTLPSDQWSVSGEMRRRVVKAFRKNGIKLAVLPTFNSCK